MKLNYTRVKTRENPFIANIDAPGLRIEKFFSYLFLEEEDKLVSEYQCLMINKAYYEIHLPNGEGMAELRAELWMHYYHKFFKEDSTSLTDAFLDFHFYQSENKADFLDYVKNCPDYFRLRYVYRKITPTELRLVKKKTNDWVAKKKKFLLSAPIKQEHKADGRIMPMRDGKPVSIWEIESFFIEKWVRPSKPGRKVNILEKNQVMNFVRAFFHGSEYPVEKKKIKSNGIQKDILDAVYEFYNTRDTDNNGIVEYLQMLIEAFEEFNSYINESTGDFNLKGLNGNFSRYNGGKKVKKRVI